MLAKVVRDSRFKVGDGKSTWNQLPWATDISNYISSSGSVQLVDDHLEVDFSQMPTDKFEALLKQLRLPIWLTQNTNVYINSDTGSDVLSEGRGFSEDLPFKTINAAYFYIVNNYNLNVYNLTFRLHGTFTENLEINGYSTSGGIIAFKSYGGEYSGKIIYTGQNVSNLIIVFSGIILIYDIEIKFNIIAKVNFAWFPAVIAAWGNSAKIDLYGPHITINLTNIPTNYVQPRVLYASIGGLIIIYPHEKFNTWLIVEGCENLAANLTDGHGELLRAESNGYIWLWSTEISQEAATIYCAGNNIISAYAVSGTISVNPGQTYKAIFKILPGKSCTGYRYWITQNGDIWTLGKGENYFPGSIAGVIQNNYGTYW